MNRGILAVLLALTGCLYADVLTADFVYEDAHARAQIDQRLPTDSRQPWQGWTAEQANFTPAPRMLGNAVTRLEVWRGDGASEFHRLNLILHFVNATLLWLLVEPFGLSAAVVATTLWLIHPIQVESVAYVSARPDLLLIAAILLLLHATRRADWLGLLGATAAGTLMVLAKETGVVAIVLLPLWLWFTGRWSPRWWIPMGTLCAGGLVVAYRLLHVSAKAGAAPWKALQLYTAAPAHGPFWSMALQCAAVWRLLALLVVPVGFTVDHDYELVGPALALVAFMAAAAVLVTAWRVRHRWPAFTFAVLWIAIVMAPRLVLPLPDAINEHQFSVAYLGICLACGSLVSQCALVSGALQHV